MWIRDSPQGALYVVATPIGNLADISLRSLHVLQLVDVVACEDTRHTQALLRAFGIDRPTAQLLAVHQHNESESAQRVIERLQQGQRVAYASDAGTPGVSDPGARLVAAVRAAGLPVVPLPGASSITAAVSVAGLVAQGADDGGLCSRVFCPPRQVNVLRQCRPLPHSRAPWCCSKRPTGWKTWPVRWHHWAPVP